MTVDNPVKFRPQRGNHIDLSYKKADIPGGSKADRKVIHNHGDTFKYARELSTDIEISGPNKKNKFLCFDEKAGC